MKSLFEEMGGSYRRVGDYFVPNIHLEEASAYQLGKYGRMRKRYLEEHRPVIFSRMVLDGSLWKHLSEVDAVCKERMEHTISAMARQEGVSEKLKAADPLEWVWRMNNIHSRAEEMIYSEVVYA